MQAELHTKLNSQAELNQDLEERLRKTKEEGVVLQEKIKEMTSQINSERENALRAQSAVTVKVRTYFQTGYFV